VKLIDEIIDELSSESGNLTDALLKTKVVLNSMGQGELVAWVNRELNGYSEDEELPEYRKVPAQVLANLASMTWTAQSHPIPIGHLEKHEQEQLQTAYMRQSLAVLQKYASSDGALESPIPLEANQRLGETLAKGVHIQRAWSEIQAASVVQILTEVRSRLLDFILGLKNELPDDPSRQEREAVDAMSLFNNSVLGDNATIVIGDKNKTQVINQHLVGNKDALAHELKKYNVHDDDIGELFEALDEDEERGVDHESKQFGESVKLWMTGMLSKAVEASWNIELGIASSILADALKHYYGW